MIAIRLWWLTGDTSELSAEAPRIRKGTGVRVLKRDRRINSSCGEIERQPSRM